MGRYTIVLKGTSTAKLKEDNPLIINGYGGDDVRIIVRTRYDDIGLESKVPRELWIEVQCDAENIDQAEGRGWDLGFSVTPWLAIAANAMVGVSRVELVFDQSLDKSEHEFLQIHYPHEFGPVKSLRFVEASNIGEVIVAALSVKESTSGRLFRAVNHYQAALMHWVPGAEILAIGFLYMAADTITKIFLDRRLEKFSGSRADVMKELQIDDPKRIDSKVRLQDIFMGDQKLYDEVSEISNALEHGYKNFNELHDSARQYRDITAQRVRGAILKLLPLSTSLLDTLETDKLLTVKGPPELTKIFRGVLVGPATQLAHPLFEYPFFEWSSSLIGLKWNGSDGYEVKITESANAKFGEGIQFVPESVSVYRN